MRTEIFKNILGTELEQTHNFGSVYSVHRIEPNYRENNIFC
jgi:hypothetical protein